MCFKACLKGHQLKAAPSLRYSSCCYHVPVLSKRTRQAHNRIKFISQSIHPLYCFSLPPSNSLHYFLKLFSFPRPLTVSLSSSTAHTARQKIFVRLVNAIRAHFRPRLHCLRHDQCAARAGATVTLNHLPGLTTTTTMAIARAVARCSNGSNFILDRLTVSYSLPMAVRRPCLQYVRQYVRVCVCVVVSFAAAASAAEQCPIQKPGQRTTSVWSSRV